MHQDSLSASPATLPALGSCTWLAAILTAHRTRASARDADCQRPSRRGDPVPWTREPWRTQGQETLAAQSSASRAWPAAGLASVHPHVPQHKRCTLPHSLLSAQPAARRVWLPSCTRHPRHSSAGHWAGWGGPEPGGGPLKVAPTGPQRRSQQEQMRKSGTEGGVRLRIPRSTSESGWKATSQKVDNTLQ